MIRVAPSILSADFTALGADIKSISDAGGDWVHFDVMDGVFVPNISIGVPVLESVRKITDLFIDVHLMIWLQCIMKRRKKRMYLQQSAQSGLAERKWGSPSNLQRAQKQSAVLFRWWILFWL